VARTFRRRLVLQMPIYGGDGRNNVGRRFDRTLCIYRPLNSLRSLRSYGTAIGPIRGRRRRNPIDKQVRDQRVPRRAPITSAAKTFWMPRDSNLKYQPHCQEGPKGSLRRNDLELCEGPIKTDKIFFCIGEWKTADQGVCARSRPHALQAPGILRLRLDTTFSNATQMDAF